MKGTLHIGFYNYVLTENIIALIDYRTSAAKKIVKSAREEKPRSVIDVTRGRKAQTLIVVSGDRYIISAIYRQQLAKRLEPVIDEPTPEEILTPKKGYSKIRSPKEDIHATVENVGTSEEE